jgi:4-diphosphocytidyl-2-C-methyl-D-erythritol kinase
MNSNGASLCQMSGSGPTVFGLFKEKENAEKCAEELKKICPNVYLTTPVNHGAKII